MTESIRRLIEASEIYLRRFDMAGARAVAEGIARWKSGTVRSPDPQPVPACGFLDEAIAAMSGADELQQAIIEARPLLHWKPYDLYPPDEIGRQFLHSHAYTPLIGSDAPIGGDDFELGLFLIAPHVLYRDHHHAAPELYAPLTGPHGWRFAPGNPFEDKPAHQPVWNESWSVHATLVRSVPFLCVFGWTRDVNIPAKVVPADDWDMIEADL